MPTDDKACGGCSYFSRMPADPMNLGDKPRGECRANPPAVVAIPMRGHGGVSVQMMAAYPMLPEDFPACALHKESEGTQSPSLSLVGRETKGILLPGDR